MSRNKHQLGKHMLAIVIGALFCCQFTLGQSAKTDPVEPAAFIDESDITWKVNDVSWRRVRLITAINTLRLKFIIFSPARRSGRWAA